MKRILALIIAVLSAIVFSSCTTVNNYYNNGSEASSETAVNSEPTVNSESATETQTIKEDTATTSAPAADAPQSTPKTNAPVL